MNENEQFQQVRSRIAEPLPITPFRSTSPPKMLGSVFNAGAMPTSVPGQFAVHPVNDYGTPTVGGTPTRVIDTTRQVIFLVAGQVVPSVGDVLVGYRHGSQWVAWRNKAVSSGIGFCMCSSMPTTIVATPSLLPWETTTPSSGFWGTLTLTWNPSQGIYIGTSSQTLFAQSGITFGLGCQDNWLVLFAINGYNPYAPWWAQGTNILNMYAPSDGTCSPFLFQNGQALVTGLYWSFSLSP